MRVWDLASGACAAVMTGHTGAVRAVAVTPDGRHVVSGSADEVGGIWAGAGGAVAYGGMGDRCIGRQLCCDTFSMNWRMASSLSHQRSNIWELLRGRLMVSRDCLWPALHHSMSAELKLTLCASTCPMHAGWSRRPCVCGTWPGAGVWPPWRATPPGWLH